MAGSLLRGSGRLPGGERRFLGFGCVVSVGWGLVERCRRWLGDPHGLFDPALLEYSGEQRTYNANVMQATAAMSSIDTSTPEGLAWIRDAMKPGGLFGFTTYDFPEVREIPGPAGPIPIRIMTP